MNYSELLEAAMKVTEQADADQLFSQMVDICTKEGGKERSECERIQKTNIGYWAGYYDHATRERVERLFNCAHPVFGKVIDGVPTPKEAFEAGMKLMEESKKKKP